MRSYHIGQGIALRGFILCLCKSGDCQTDTDIATLEPLVSIEYLIKILVWIVSTDLVCLLQVLQFPRYMYEGTQSQGANIHVEMHDIMILKTKHD